MPATENTSRLEPVVQTPFAPFLRAANLPSVALYWIQVNDWPPYFSERLWLLRVLDGLSRSLEQEKELFPLQFLQAAVATRRLHSLFLKHSRDYVPVLGSMVRPGRKPVEMPDEATLAKAKEDKVALPVDNAEDQSYWMLRGSDRDQRATFFGYSAMTILYRKSDAAAKIALPSFPEYILKHPGMAGFDPQQMESAVRTTEHLRSKFGKTSKDLYGAPFRTRSYYDGLIFTIPVWNSADFFAATDKELDDFFSLGDVYVQESAADRGILIASRLDLDEVLSKAVTAANEAREAEKTTATGEAKA